MKVLLIIFLSLLLAKATLAQGLSNPSIGRSANFSSLAARQYLSGKSDESLALYQKAIAKAETEYGKSSRVIADLYYQLGVRALWLSKFNLAERSLKKAVEINPNSEAAQLMLINVLRFRNRDAEAYGHIQQGLKKHPDSAGLRKNLVISLQDRDPLRATQQAYLVNCTQNGLTDRLPAPKQEPIKQSNKIEKGGQAKQDKSEHHEQRTKPSPQNTAKPTERTDSVKAVYEPIKTTNTKPVKVRKTASLHKSTNNSSKLPAGLVPPPPPDAISFPTFSGRALKAKAGSIKAEKAQPASVAEEQPKPAAVEHPSADSDPDFLIEWASVKKKKGAGK